MFNNVVRGEFLEKRISEVLKDIEKTVGFTYGPNGSPVAFISRDSGFPEASKDGLTIARHMKYQNELENTILNYIVVSAIDQEKEVGDGTTTLTLLTCELYRQLSEYISKNNIQKSVAVKIFVQVKELFEVLIKEKAVPLYAEDGVLRTSLLDLLIYTATDGNSELTDVISKIYKNSNNPKIQINFSNGDKHIYKHTTGIDIFGQVLFKDQLFNEHHLKRLDSGVSTILVRGVFAPSYQNFADLMYRLRADDKNLIVVCNNVGDDVHRFMNGADTIKTGLTSNIFFVTLSTHDVDDFANLGALFSAKTTEGRDLQPISNDQFVDYLMSQAALAETAILSPNGVSLFGTKKDEVRLEKIVEEYNRKIQEVIDEQGEGPQSEMIINMLKSKIDELSRDFIQLFIGGETEGMARYNMALADDAIRSVESAKIHGVVDGMNAAILEISDDFLDDVIDIDLSYREQIIDFMKIVRNSYMEITKRLAIDGNEEFIQKVIERKIINLRFGDENVPVINSAMTDLVILSNAADNIIFFMMSAFLGSRADVAVNDI